MSRTSRRIMLPLVVAGGALLASPRAHAQVADPEARATRGVHVAGGARAGDADPTALATNPAQLGLLPAGGLSLVGNLGSRDTALAGRGVGAFLGGPALHGGLALALAYEASAPRLGVDAHGTFQLGYALRLGGATALGASWTHVWGGAWRGTDTFDLGASRRFGRWAALGLVVEDVGAPALAPSAMAAGVTLHRLWAGEVAVRPLGTDRLELALGAAHVEDDRWRWLAPRARVGARLWRGLRAFAVGTTLPRGTALAFASGADYEAELGLAVDLDHVGLTAAGRGAFPGAGGGAAGGDADLVLRLEHARRPPLVAATVVARVRLENVAGEREYVALVRRLRALAFDPTVAAVLLHVESEGLGLGRVEELRDLVAGLRARGKKVYAYGAYPATRDYYLATACDGIVMHPAGALSLTGFAQTATFYKRAMDAVGVHVDLVRIAEYKGAMEPFVFEEQTGPVRANRNAILDDVYGRLLAAIVRARGGGKLDEAGARALVDRGLFTPEEARAAGLVDAVSDDEGLGDFLARALGRAHVEIRDPDRAPLVDAWPSRKVAVLLVEGTIVDGPSHRFPFGLGTVAGSDTLVAALEACGKDGSVGAVVLRVNSPGGSAFASDVVARAIVKLRKAGKPVVVSMGDIAASGGYYVSAPADAIFAEPSTLSGSIGIFAYKVDVQKLMERFGLGAETLRRGEHADFLSPYRPWTPDEVKIASEKIRHLYDLFLTTVADGRKSRGLTRARVDEIGRGHVWTGAEARELGLVDRMGGLADAIDYAAGLARVPTNRDGFPALAVLPHEPQGLAQLVGSMALDVDPNIDLDAESDAEALVRARIESLDAPALRLLAPLLLGDGAGIEARLPYDLDLR